MIPNQAGLDTPVKVAVVGLGRAGWDLHFEPLASNSNFQVSAVADPRPEVCGKAVLATQCQSFSSIDDLLRKTDADLIVVATPSQFHEEDAMKVLRSGRHCVLEKPMALHYAGAQSLMKMASDLGKRLFVHHNLIHEAEFHRLRSFLESGRLGPVFHIRRFRGSYRRRNDWQSLRQCGGGLLSNHGPHVLCTLLPLLGTKVSRVYSKLVQVKDPGDAEDHVHLVLDTESGLSVDVVITSSIALGLPAWMVCGRYGTLVSEGRDFRIRYFDPGLPKGTTAPGSSSDGEEAEEIHWIEELLPPYEEPVSSFYQNVADVLAHGAGQMVTVESALEVLRVINMAQAAQAEPVETSSV